MDFSVISQLKNKKFWWMDVIFYFAISLLIATVLCYVIFLTKDIFQREDIQKEDAALQTVGTADQKNQEKEVISYQKKIGDFSNLLKNHEFASNVFAFMEAQTMPNVWFKQFSLDSSGSQVQLSGESDSLDALSRQVANLETGDSKKYVDGIGSISSSLGQSAKVDFSVTLTLDKNIFSYLSSDSSIIETVSPAEQQNQSPAGNQSNAATGSQQFTASKSSEKLITSFHLLLNPEVVGLVNETNYTIALNVPNNTNVKNLTSSIVISPGATVSPASNIPQDFTNPVIYTVTAQDGSIQNYTVKVIVSAPAGGGESGEVELIVSAIILIVIVVVIAVFLFIRKKSKSQKIKS